MKLKYVCLHLLFSCVCNWNKDYTQHMEKGRFYMDYSRCDVVARIFWYQNAISWESEIFDALSTFTWILISLIAWKKLILSMCSIFSSFFNFTHDKISFFTASTTHRKNHLNLFFIHPRRIYTERFGWCTLSMLMRASTFIFLIVPLHAK